MCRVAWLLVALFAVADAGAPLHAADREERIREAERLHGNANYVGAMEAYRSVLKDYPHEPAAVYGLAYSWFSGGKRLDELVAFLEAELASGVEQDPRSYAILGRTHGALGAHAKAEPVLRRAVELMPDRARSHQQLGVNLAAQNRPTEALDAFLESARLDPRDVETWLGIAAAAEALERPARAFFSGARAAGLEPASLRGRVAAMKAWIGLFAGLAAFENPKAPEGAGAIVFVGPVKVTGGDERDRTPASIEEITIAAMAAQRFSPPWKSKSDAEFCVFAFGALIGIFSGLDFVAEDPFWRLTLPWFVELKESGHAETFTYLLLRSAGDEDAARWVARHDRKVEAYEAWARGGAR
ncbi:MAG TPA: hypothetical protein VF139_11310 [Candidatus Polarisedimenticolaceae bacterium]